MQLVSMRFDRFSLDPSNRLLLCDGVPVELSGRYLDALTLLTAEAGRLVSKDRFLDEVRLAPSRGGVMLRTGLGAVGLVGSSVAIFSNLVFTLLISANAILDREKKINFFIFSKCPKYPIQVLKYICGMHIFG